MTGDEVLDLLRAHKPLLVERFGVTQLALFGSFARDQATDRSDVDILVQFDGPATAKSYFGLQFYLEDLLSRPVDLVTTKALRNEFRPYVEREATECDSSLSRLQNDWTKRLYVQDMIGQRAHAYLRLTAKACDR